jgi:hypothetical protein
MSYSIVSPLTRRAAPRRRRRGSRGPGSWLLVLVEGLAEGYTARGRYHKLMDMSLKPEVALRVAFDLQSAKDRQPGYGPTSTKTEQDQ